MNDRIWDSVGAATGAVAIALMLLGVTLAAGGESPEPSQPSADIARVFIEQSDQTEQGGMITLVGLAFFFGFLGYFRRRLQQAEGEGGWLTSTAYGGGLVTAAMLLVLASMQLATTSVSEGTEPVVAKVFVLYFWNFVFVFAPPMMAFTLGASLVIVRYRALPRWTGWLGFVVALSLLLPWIGAPLVFAWVLIVSLVLLVQVWRAPQPEGAVAEPQAA